MVSKDSQESSEKATTLSDPPSQPFQAFHELNLNLENIASEKSSYSLVKESTFESLSSLGKSDGSSDKENKTKKAERKTRKVAKLTDSNTEISSEHSNARKESNSHIHIESFNPETIGTKRKDKDTANYVPVKLARIDKIVGTDEAPFKYQDEGTQTNTIALGGEGNKVKHRNRRRIVAKIVQPTGNVTSYKRPSNLKPKKSTETVTKNTANSKDEQNEKPTKIADVRPWRVNMKPPSANIEASIEVSIPEKKGSERPWRVNMKAAKGTPENIKELVPKKPSYNRDEVRRFMLAKKKKDKEERMMIEKENMLKQELIKQRLIELEKLQKQIAETEIEASKKSLKVNFLSYYCYSVRSRKTPDQPSYPFQESYA